MSEDVGGMIIFGLMIVAAIVGMNLPVPGGKPNTDALLAEIVRRIARKL